MLYAKITLDGTDATNGSVELVVLGQSQVESFQTRLSGRTSTDVFVFTFIVKVQQIKPYIALHCIRAPSSQQHAAPEVCA